MEIGNWDHGHLQLIPVKRTLPHDSNMEFDLANLPSTINGQPAAVVCFLLGTPNVSVPTWPAQQTFGDGVSVSQVLGSSLRLSMSPECPYNAFDGGDVLIAGVDGYRALEMLAWTSGLPTIFGADTENATAPTGAGNATVYSLASALAGQFMGEDFAGPLRKVFPIGQGANAAAGAFSDSLWFCLPVGVQSRGKQYEDISDTAIPNTMFNGDGYDLAGNKIQGSSGKLLWSPGTKIDNATITYGANWSLWALCLQHSPSKQPSPTPPMIRQLGGSGDSSWNARAGIREYLGFMKPLTAAGAQQTHDYTTVNVTVNGKLIVEPTIATNRIAQSFMRARNSWRPTQAENALPNRAATRYSRNDVALVFRDGSVLHAPGSVNALTRVDIVVTGETTHYLMDCTRTPVTDQVRARAIAWNGRAGARRRAGTRNGNPLNPQAEAIIAPLLPGKIISETNAGFAPESGVMGPQNQATTVQPGSGAASAPATKAGK